MNLIKCFELRFAGYFGANSVVSKLMLNVKKLLKRLFFFLLK